MIEFRDSVLCRRCENVGHGVVVAREPVCNACIIDDRALLRQVVYLVMGNDAAARLERAVNDKLGGQE